MHILVRKRADLPEMTLPLLLMAVLLSAAAAWMGAKISLSSLAGPVAALPFFALSAAVYCSVIILWRKAAALLVAPITAFCLWVSGCGMFCVLTVSLSLLFVSYLAGIYLLAGETRFIRMTSLSCGIAVALTLCTFAGLSLRYDSFSAFYEETLAVLEVLLQQVSETGNVPLAANTTSDILYTIFLSLPALLGVTAELLAASILFLCSTFLRILDCAEYFHPAADNGITTPRSFGAISLVILILTLLTSPYDNPLFYSILSNILSVISLPCAYVGVREFFGRMQKRFTYYHLSQTVESRRRFPLSAILLFLFLTLLLGIDSALFLSSAVGAMYILRAKKAEDNAADHLSGS